MLNAALTQLTREYERDMLGVVQDFKRDDEKDEKY